MIWIWFGTAAHSSRGRFPQGLGQSLCQREHRRRRFQPKAPSHSVFITRASCPNDYKNLARQGLPATLVRVEDIRARWLLSFFFEEASRRFQETRASVPIPVTSAQPGHLAVWHSGPRPGNNSVRERFSSPGAVRSAEARRRKPEPAAYCPVGGLYQGAPSEPALRAVEGRAVNHVSPLRL
jgi:hypothetical protein